MHSLPTLSDMCSSQLFVDHDVNNMLAAAGAGLIQSGCLAAGNEEESIALCSCATPFCSLLPFSPSFFQWLERKFGRVLCVKKGVSEKVEQYLI